MERHKLVSVIIPTYNSERTIRKSIESVTNQTYEEIEIVVVDDASTDDTVKIINAIGDSRIRLYVNKINKGACYSRNKGVQLAKGEYIAFEDSDDIWLPEKLEKCMKYFQGEKFDTVFSAYLLNEKEIVPKYNLNNSNDKFLDHMLYFCVDTPTIVSKKNVFLDEPFNEIMPRFQDYEVMLRILQKYKVYYIDEPLIKSYKNETGITSNPQKGVDALNIIMKEYYEVLKNNPNVWGHLYELMAKFTELGGENGKRYFYKAYMLGKKKKDIIYCFLCLLRIYVPLYRFWIK